MKMSSFAILATLMLAPAGLAACGSSSSSGSTSTAPPAAAPAPSPSPSAPAAAGSAVVATAAATVGGKSETILTDAQGLTLYYRTSDTATNVCAAGCASAWPPVLLPQGTPTSSSPLTGTLATLSDANGRQVTYNGHPLYRFANDSGPGSAKGDGIAGVWFAATPGLT